MSQPAPAPLRLVNNHTGEFLELLRVQRPGGLGLRLRGSLPPHRDGPPRHVHFLENERGRVTAGVLSVELAGQRMDLESGKDVELPRGIPHRWWNQGDAVLEFEGQLEPLVDLDRYLQAIFEIMNAGPKDRPPLIYLAHAALRHRRSQAVLVLPPLVQAVVFRIAWLVGTALGRYRGTAWPGCPARCSGAPQVIEQG
ncbi:MAG TPA: cupin domain-containing protein [Gemmatimonadales bacterium]|nr:cupin domain-containing protein [Gemmatimonadales bacterium]